MGLLVQGGGVMTRGRGDVIGLGRSYDMGGGDDDMIWHMGKMTWSWRDDEWMVRRRNGCQQGCDEDTCN